jgi:hypothetical protein
MCGFKNIISVIKLLRKVLTYPVAPMGRRARLKLTL